VKTLLYLKSFFDEPLMPGKGSMARLCMFLLSVGAAVGFMLGHDIAGAGGAIGAVGVSFSRTKAGSDSAA
jgi:hypothetical protein